MTCNLISGHITSGVKQAGIYHGHFYGTREVSVLRGVNNTCYVKGHKTLAADQIVVVMKSLKGDGAKGLTCLGFELTNNQKWDD